MRVTYLSSATENVASVIVTEKNVLIFRQKKRNPKEISEAEFSIVFPLEQWANTIKAFSRMVQFQHSGRKWIEKNSFTIGELTCKPFSETNKGWVLESPYSEGIIPIYRQEVEYFLYTFIPKVEWKKTEVRSDFTLDNKKDVERRIEEEDQKSGGISQRLERSKEGLSNVGHRNKTPKEDDSLDAYIKTLRCKNRHPGTFKYWIRASHDPADINLRKRGRIVLVCSVCKYTRILTYALKVGK